MVSIVAKLFILFSMAGNERKHLIFPFGFFDFPHPRIQFYLYVLIKLAKLALKKITAEKPSASARVESDL